MYLYTLVLGLTGFLNFKDQKLDECTLDCDCVVVLKLCGHFWLKYTPRCAPASRFIVAFENFWYTQQSIYIYICNNCIIVHFMLVVLLLPSCYWKKTTLKRIYYNNTSLSSTSFWKLWQLYRKWPPRRRAMVRLMCTLFVARQFWMQPKQEKDRKPLNAKVYLPKMDTSLVPLSPQAKLPNSVQFYSDSWTYPSCRLKEYGQLI